MGQGRQEKCLVMSAAAFSTEMQQRLRASMSSIHCCKHVTMLSPVCSKVHKDKTVIQIQSSVHTERFVLVKNTTNQLFTRTLQE